MLKGYGCPGHSVMAAAIAAVEIARVDGSMSTFVLVHTFLAVLTIGAQRRGAARVAGAGRWWPGPITCAWRCLLPHTAWTAQA